MQERVNKHKPLSKKEVQETTNGVQEFTLKENSKISSSSQNKLFTRKPVSQRNFYVSPTFVKNKTLQNQQSIPPYIALKSKKSVPDIRSDQDYWERQEKSQLENKNIIKRNSSNQNDLKQQQKLFGNTQAIKQAYFGNDMHALTQIGQNYIVQMVESENSQKDQYFGKNMKKHVKENLALNAINSQSKKVTRTQYFISKNDQVRSNTSRSLKQKQINFSQLKSTLNNNIDAYTSILEQNIRKLQKTIYTLNKKCKWMHQEVQMHLQKEHLMESQNKGLSLEVKTNQNKIKRLNQQMQSLRKQLSDMKLTLQAKQSPIRYKSFKDLQTISSLKQLGQKKQSNSLVQSRAEQAFHGYFGSSPSSIQKNKKLSFKTYPGVITPKKRKQELSKCSSIVGNNDSYQDLGQTSIFNEKSILKNQLHSSGSSLISESLKRDKQLLKIQLQSLKEEMIKLKLMSEEQISQNNLQNQTKTNSMQEQIQIMRNQIVKIQQEKKDLSDELDRILIAHQSEVEILNFKIKQLQNNIVSNSKKSIQFSKEFKDLEGVNPLQYFLDHQTNQVHHLPLDHFEHQNKSLRIYIQNVLQHYKYIKIQNRMLLKVKEDLQRQEKEKKQIKEERDMFKKKLLQMIKIKNNQAKSAKNSKGSMDSESEQSEEQLGSVVFELSQSEIIYQQSEITDN